MKNKTADKKVPDNAQEVNSAQNTGFAGGGITKPKEPNSKLKGTDLTQQQARESTSNPKKDQDQ